MNTIKEGKNISYAFSGISLIFLLCNKSIWPSEGFHEVLLHFLKILPLTQPVDSLSSIVFRGWSLEHPIVLKGFLSLFFWICVLIFYNIKKIL
jgi:hypothetical protein